MTTIRPAKGRQTGRPNIGACSASEKLARGIHHLLLRLGIQAVLSDKKVKYNGSHRIAWQVIICGERNTRKFIDIIPLKAKIRNFPAVLAQDQLSNSDNRYLDTVPKEAWVYIKQRQAELGLSNMEVYGAESRQDNQRLYTKYAISRSKLRVYAANLQDDYLQSLADSTVLWDEVVSLEYVGERETSDLSVPETGTPTATEGCPGLTGDEGSDRI